jgi:hypothetical protein
VAGGNELTEIAGAGFEPATSGLWVKSAGCSKIAFKPRLIFESYTILRPTPKNTNFNKIRFIRPEVPST